MDWYRQILETELESIKKASKPDALKYLFILRDLIKYNVNDINVFNKLAEILFANGRFWEAYSLSNKAIEIEVNQDAKKILNNIANPPLPETLTIEVTNICNLKCPICRTGAGMDNRKKQSMSFSTFQGIYDNLKQSIKNIIFVGQGESFLNNDIYKILKYPVGVHKYIDTNGNVDIDFDKWATRFNKNRIEGLNDKAGRGRRPFFPSGSKCSCSENGLRAT
ncbi:MAG: hypothetical protein HQK70_15505, partial [Desulfamplus sp.]|nr:hypothetical protein [Desulfamplus sp.]